MKAATQKTAKEIPNTTALDNLTDLLQEQGGIPADKNAGPVPPPRK